MKTENIRFKTMIFPILLFMVMVISIEFSQTQKSSSDETCSNCHNMYNYQNDPNSPIGPLLKDDCLGCHSSDTSSTYYDMGGFRVPVVNYTGPDAPTTYLVGGNFWWVKKGHEGADNSKGHNVFLEEGDDNLSSAPGGIPGRGSVCGTNSCHENLHSKYNGIHPGLQGRQGCTGCHMLDDLRQPQGFHHTNNGGPYDVINDFPWYRFLKGHASDNSGVSGIEDPDWEASNDSVDHNEYLGKHQTGGNNFEENTLLLNYTMDAFCCGCHPRFYDQKKNGAWVRHPSGVVIPNLGEYNAYTTYDPLVPVARPFLSSINPVVSPGEDLVTCISCHRPHGSPYPNMLRWDPSTSDGCIICHTQKLSSHVPCSGSNSHCGNCHAMHYSENGGVPAEWRVEGPYSHLLKNIKNELCLICHSDITIDMNLEAGWNMISLPVIPNNPGVSELFPEAVKIYGFEKEAGYKSMTKEEELEVGKGYWILLYEDQNYSLTGKSIPEYTLIVDEDGWSMIGGCSSPARALINIGNIVVIYGYIPGAGYQRLLESENMECGKGYWILFSGITAKAELKVEGLGERVVDIKDE